MVRINGKLVHADVELTLSPTGIVLISVLDHSNQSTLDFALQSNSEPDRARVAQAAMFYRLQAKEVLEG